MDMSRRYSPRLNKNVQRSQTIKSSSDITKDNPAQNYSSRNSPTSRMQLRNRLSNNRGQNKTLTTGSTSDKENALVSRFTTLRKSTSIQSLNPLSALNIKQLRVGATKTAQSFRTTFDSLSQRLRRSTRRRHRLMTTPSPTTPSRRRTPLKMYSPFRIDTPSKGVYFGGTAGRYTPRRRFHGFSSPSCSFKKDVDAVNSGAKQLNAIADRITFQSSFRKVKP